MVTTVLFLLTISSGSFLSAVLWRKKYEEILPLTCTAIVAILFIFGILGALKYGMYFICIAVVLVYVISFMKLIKQKNYLEAITPFFNWGFLAFALMLCVIAWCMRGKMFDSWDEFSHWGDVVKVMTSFDDFATNSSTYSWFKSYPPGMGLFQYFLQKIWMFTSGG